MSLLDLVILAVYMAAMLGVGLYFYRKNSDLDDYYVAGRSLGRWHVGFSVVATDVGGGFSIGLGGLGFSMGLSGSWLLFTGLIGAWLSAVLLVPRIKRLEKSVKLYTFPQMFGHFFGSRTAALAAVISAIGYIGFTSSQLLAGAKLASASFEGLSLISALVIMGAIAVGYTALGGLKAVIYTDSIQWAVLLAGLIFVGIPAGYTAIGGWEAIVATLPEGHLSMTEVGWSTFTNWMITIVPIWFVAMTLYQRIYACRDEKEARAAWYIAGILEWPLMAFMGVTLGMFARVAAEKGLLAGSGVVVDAEMGLPLFLVTTLPSGLLGLVLAAYFSAILSTADSCLMAASGNVVTDLLRKNELRYSQIATLLIGVAALALAAVMPNVLELMLHSYAFMVSGLFIPALVALFARRHDGTAAFCSMLLGGSTTLGLTFGAVGPLPLGLDPNFYGILVSVIAYFGVAYLRSSLGIKPAISGS